MDDALHDQCRHMAIRDCHNDLLTLLEPHSIEHILDDVDIAFWYALSLLSVIRYAEGKSAAVEFERRVHTKTDRLIDGRHCLLQALISIMDGDTDKAMGLASKAATTLPEDALHERFRAWATLDTLAGHTGDVSIMEAAAEHLLELRDLLPLDQRWWYSFVIPNRADLLAKKGLLFEAETLLQTQLSASPPDCVPILRLRLAILAIERNDGSLAAEWLDPLDDLFLESYWSLEYQLIAAEIQRLRGDHERALAILQEALPTRTRHQSRVEVLRLQVKMCQIWIEQGQIQLAAAWFNLVSRSLDDWPRTFGHPIPKLTQASLEMARGEWQRAIRLLTILRDEGLRRDHKGILVAIYTALAFCYDGLGDHDSAVQMAQSAIDAGANGAFARSYQVFGLDVHRLLTDYPTDTGTQWQQQTKSATRLSKREIQLLGLVAAGKSNTDIADGLYLSISTVKNHLSSIYKRLGVTNRSDAVSIAREMGLLSSSSQHTSGS